jgi:hypothetical protein
MLLVVVTRRRRFHSRKRRRIVKDVRLAVFSNCPDSEQ